MSDISLVKKAILVWTYNTLNKKFPEYFNSNDWQNISGTIVKNSPNVYWSNTVWGRPLDSTECYLTIVNDKSYQLGTQGNYYVEDGKMYYSISEQHYLTVRFSVCSMKNSQLNLTSLQAQNLVEDACVYLRSMLKSGSASDYFTYTNGIKDNILVCSQANNVSDVVDVSMFEDTKDKFTSQFTCLFRYDSIEESIEVDMAQGVSGEIEYGKGLAEGFEIEFNPES